MSWLYIGITAANIGTSLYTSSQQQPGVTNIYQQGATPGVTTGPGGPTGGITAQAPPVNQPNYLNLPAPIGGVSRQALNLPGYDRPIDPYATSPYYGGAQEELSKLGVGLLKGDIPDYYKGIGEIGGETFENVIKGVRTDIERGVTAQAARLGQRGGAPLEVAGREMARVTPALRWQEMVRGIEGRKSLLGLGAEITTGVRGAGLVEAGQRQTYQQNLAQMGLSERQFQAKLQLNKEQFTHTLNEEMRQFTEQLQLARDRDEISQDQFNQSLAFKREQLAVQQRMWQAEIDQKAAEAKGGMWGNIISGAMKLGGAVDWGDLFGGGDLGTAGGPQYTGAEMDTLLASPGYQTSDITFQY